MSNEIVKLDFTQDQINLIRTQIAPKATDDELKLFIYQAKRTGLDPLARQIYAIHRKAKDQNGNWGEKMTIQTSIDGFRVIAERSGDYAGQDEPIFEENGRLIKATVKVYRFKGDQRYCAAVGVAYWSEYVQTDKDGKPYGLWLKMPHTMLAKVAEALALRKAYPQDLSGLYTGDEMDQTEQPRSDQNDILFYWGNEIANCQKESDLVNLYNGNKETVDGDPAIKELFKKRQAELKNKNKLATA